MLHVFLAGCDFGGSTDPCVAEDATFQCVPGVEGFMCGKGKNAWDNYG